MTQGEAVFQAVLKVVGEINGKVELTESQGAAVREHVVQAFLTGQTQHKSNPPEAELRKYVPGLINNWLRKDKRLNGGEKYQAKNPGSRTGSSDESLKAMKALLSVAPTDEARAEIEAAIEARKAELKPKVEINVDALPAHLRSYAAK